MSPLKLQALLEEAIVHHRAGRLAEAETCYRQARAAAPKRFDILHLSGTLAYQQGRIAEACDWLGRAVRLDPASAVCRMRLGLALIAAGRLADAERALREAVRRKPDFVEAWDNLAYCLKAQDRLPEALPIHERVVALKPDYATGWHNFGLTLLLLGHADRARACHERALATRPDYVAARLGRAQALQHENRIAEAVAEYDRLLALQPDHHEARSSRLMALHYLEGLSREEIFAAHVAFGRAVGPAPGPHLANTPDPDRRLRVAVWSPDLREHSCAYFIEPMLQHLDRAGCELLLYLDHIREDAVSARLRPLGAVWRNFVGQPNPAVEAAIRADGPDILIDLAGHTGLSARLPLYGRRLAPVQITYLGYPDTTGLPAMDYRFTDAIADPPGDADRFATETLVRFSPTAWSYLPPVAAPDPGPPPSGAGAPFTFGCFNNPAKITAATLRTWAEILAAVPRARLLLKGRGLSGTDGRDRMLRQLAQAGIPAARVELAERSADTSGHLARYREVDVALDTFPYNGTTTTCEALWMGVPVVTRCGDRHAARVGASLLAAAGHPEWTASSADDYRRIAVALAEDPARLTALHAGLRDALRGSVLLDHAGQAARFGAALRDCWRAWCHRTRSAAA